MTPKMSDAQLVERSLTGDRDAFARIVKRYQSLVKGEAAVGAATGARPELVGRPRQDVGAHQSRPWRGTVEAAFHCQRGGG